MLSIAVNYRLPAWAGGQWRDCYLVGQPTPLGGQPDSKAGSTKYVIARRAKAERPTWQSPGTIYRTTPHFPTLYREIATSLRSSQ